jgi:hypothetical protein
VESRAVTRAARAWGRFIRHADGRLVERGEESLEGMPDRVRSSEDYSGTARCRSKPLTPCDPESISRNLVLQGRCKCSAVRKEIEGRRTRRTVDRAFAALRLDEKPPSVGANLVAQDEVRPKRTNT